MRLLKPAMPLLVLSGGGVISTTLSYGRAESIHIKAASKDLNEVGKCYEKNKSLEGCEAKEEK